MVKRAAFMYYLTTQYRGPYTRSPLTQRSASSYCAYVKRIESELNIDLDISDLRRNDVNKVIARLQAEGRAVGMPDATLKNCISGLQAYAQFRGAERAALKHLRKTSTPNRSLQSPDAMKSKPSPNRSGGRLGLLGFLFGRHKHLPAESHLMAPPTPRAAALPEPPLPSGDPRAAYESGDYATALSIWRPLASQGNPGAQYRLGVMYEIGKGVPQAYDEALHWYRKAAEQGFPAPQFNLGRMYELGRGVVQDHAEAAKWYLRSAGYGYASAQASLGCLYLRGQGVAQDYARAFKWLDQAVSTYAVDDIGWDDALKSRDLAASMMTADQLAETRRLAKGRRE
jgi:TPR repeat protein